MLYSDIFYSMHLMHLCEANPVLFLCLLCSLAQQRAEPPEYVNQDNSMWLNCTARPCQKPLGLKIAQSSWSHKYNCSSCVNTTIYSTTILHYFAVLFRHGCSGVFMEIWGCLCAHHLLFCYEL